MCCEGCPRYEKCEDGDRLKDNCCTKCPEYHDCVSIDERGRDSFRDVYSDSSYEDYS